MLAIAAPQGCSGEVTYTIVVVDIRSDLVLFVFLSGVLGFNLAIWRDKPVARKLSFTVNVSNVELQGPHLGELENKVRPKKGIDSKFHELTVTKENKSLS
jgi:hypothetical protein